MTGVILSMVAVSLVAFTLLGLVQRWSWRLSLTYAGTMTVFIGVIAGLATVAAAAVRS